MLISFQHNGASFENWTIEDAQGAGVPQNVIDTAVNASNRQSQRSKMRANIGAKAGDDASLLGTTSDAAALAIYGLASLVAKLSTAQSLADVREAAEPFAQLSAGFLTKVENGEVLLPFMLKGLDTVVADIETRATAVSQALQEASEG